jgi:hypothetical protein
MVLSALVGEGLVAWLEKYEAFCLNEWESLMTLVQKMENTQASSYGLET